MLGKWEKKAAYATGSWLAELLFPLTKPPGRAPRSLDPMHPSPSPADPAGPRGAAWRLEPRETLGLARFGRSNSHLEGQKIFGHQSWPRVSRPAQTRGVHTQKPAPVGGLEPNHSWPFTLYESPGVNSPNHEAKTPTKSSTKTQLVGWSRGHTQEMSCYSHSDPGSSFGSNQNPIKSGTRPCISDGFVKQHAGTECLKRSLGKTCVLTNKKRRLSSWLEKNIENGTDDVQAEKSPPVQSQKQERNPPKKGDVRCLRL